MYKDTVVGLDQCMSHEEIVNCIDVAVNQIVARYRDGGNPPDEVKAERLQNAFTFFVSSVSKKLKINISQDLCKRTISNQIFFHKKLLTLPKDELMKLIPET